MGQLTITDDERKLLEQLNNFGPEKLQEWLANPENQKTLESIPDLIPKMCQVSEEQLSKLMSTGKHGTNGTETV